MLIAGLGKADEGATWTYEFSGHKNPTGIAILKGSMQSEQPKGTTFLFPDLTRPIEN